jgi:hypothetical protein
MSGTIVSPFIALRQTVVIMVTFSYFTVNKGFSARDPNLASGTSRARTM